jgi:hypothetical protein
MLYFKAIDLIGGIYFKQDENESHVGIFDTDVGILPNSAHEYVLCPKVSMRGI